MSRYFGWAVLVLVLPLYASGADVEEKKADPSDTKAKTETVKKAPHKDGEVVALFHDGTRVRTVLLQDSVEVITKYGKLTVPTKDIRRVEFGFRLSGEAGKKLEQAIKDLASNNFQAREAATKDLIAMGRQAYPALVKASKDNDLETTRRVEDILKGIREKVAAELLRSRTDDLIHTTDFTIAGRITAPVLKAKTDHFGDVDLKVVDLRSMESTLGSDEMKLIIDAAIYAAGNNQWLDTKFMATPDVKLVVTAQGEVDLYGNQNPGQFLSGPDGSRQFGRQGQHMPGTLLAKIGEDGAPFVVGKLYQGTPAIEGKLFLRIVPIQNSGGATGNYQVKVTSGNNSN
jgi:hypothetical protein